MSNYLIIGGSSGIGRQLALSLSSAANTVYATYFKNPAVSDKPSLIYHYLDVNEDSLSFDYLPDIIDGIVYCPGSINLKSFARILPEEFAADYKLQVLGAVKVLQAVLPKLKQSTAGSIVLFSTVAVQTGLNFHTQVAASKGAIEGLCRALAAELSPKVRVNCIAPSLTDTPLASKLLDTEQKREANAQRHPLCKVGTPADIANLAEFLLSEKSGWITGQVMHVDGGLSSVRI